jgi:hypothetical protein
MKKAKWMKFTMCWCHYTMQLLQKRAHIFTNQVDMVFTNCSKEDVIYTFTITKIAQAQEDDSVLKKLSQADSIPLN